MKKILSLVFLLACTFTMMQAQDAVAKKACSKSSKACAKSCAAKKAKSAATTADVNVTRVAAAYMVADEAAAADESIEKRVCEKSGSVSYYQKSVCEKSGSVSWNEVSFCDKSKAFSAVNKDGAAVQVSDNGTKVASASKEKACCSKGAKKACSKADMKACAKGTKKSCSKSAVKATSAAMQQ